MEIVLTDENFEREVENAKLPVLVDFFAVWCEPCKILTPILESLAEEMEGKIILAKANLDENPLAAQKFGIEKIPTVVFFRGGKPVSGFLGVRPPETIKEWLKNL